MKWILGTLVLLFAFTLVGVAQEEDNQFNSLPNSSTMSMEEQKPTMANTDVLHEINSRLSTNPELNNTEVAATVTDSSVILEGYVDSPQQRERVKGIAEEFSDNREIVDHLQLGGASTAY